MTEETLKPEEKTIEERGANLPEYLRRALQSKEKMQEAADNQKLWRERSSSPYLHQTPQTAAINAARRQLPEWVDAFTQVEIELRSAIEQQEVDTERIAFLTERFKHFAALLAECLATLGEYRQAAEIHPDENMRKEYERISEAIDRPDTEECGEECEDKFKDDPGLISRHHVSREVWYAKHGRMMPMVVCNVCGHANVRPETVALKQERQARRRAEELTRGLSKDRAAKLLREAGLTPDKIFK